MMKKEAKHLNKFLENNNSTIREALSKIDANKKGFLIILNQVSKVVGVITDGDIRRALLFGSNLDSSINEIYTRDFNCLSGSSTFNEVCEMFRVEQNDFLPILTDKKQIVNIVTRSQFNTLMLQDFEFNILYDFSSLDDIPIEHEIYNSPWGFYKTTFISDDCQAKIITVFPNGELSLQEHKKRDEHWVVIKGNGEVVLGESKINIYPGKYIYVPKGCKHKVINNTQKNIVFSEIQLGEYFGEDDIIRYQDKYNRN
jgi:mannose-1-phosphate guanylyltransferase / mannose-6-phosphate isomerase